MRYENQICNYFDRLKAVLDTIEIKDIDMFCTILKDAYEKGKTIFIMGNGGSGTTSSHLACDYNKGVCGKSKKKFKVISLVDNMPVILAIANDLSYDKIFVEQLKNHMTPGDIVIGLSGSGNSRNVIEAVNYANDSGCVTIGLCGYDGGQLKKLCRHSVQVKINDMQIVEDVHLIVGHIIMQIMDSELSSL